MIKYFCDMENINELLKQKNADSWREFYLRNPDILIERYFNIKLLWYQKILLKGMIKDAK